MNEAKAVEIAKAMGGEIRQMEGEFWVVVIRKGFEERVVISDDAICEYEDEHAFERGEARIHIELR